MCVPHFSGTVLAIIRRVRIFKYWSSLGGKGHFPLCVSFSQFQRCRSNSNASMPSCLQTPCILQHSASTAPNWLQGPVNHPYVWRSHSSGPNPPKPFPPCAHPPLPHFYSPCPHACSVYPNYPDLFLFSLCSLLYKSNQIPESVACSSAIPWSCLRVNSLLHFCCL